MRKTTCFLTLFFLLATTYAFAASPVIHSITPNKGSVAGGTTVTIKGANFLSPCSPCPDDPRMFVYFGSMAATNVTLVDDTTLTAVTPAQLPGTVKVVYVDRLGSAWPNFAEVENGFTFEGQVSEGFERVLFPLLTGPVPGAFGTIFRTSGSLWHAGSGGLPVFGIDTNCTLIDPPIQPSLGYYLGTEYTHKLFPECYEGGARFFYVPRGRGHDLAASLRVYEETRQSQNHGVEIPVVHEEDFRTRIALLDVPFDPRFRLTLRIYALNNFNPPLGATIRFADRVVNVVFPQPESIFAPPMVTFTDFQLPANTPPGTTMRVIVEYQRGHHIDPDNPIWAFIAVTNNETQHITTITPN